MTEETKETKIQSFSVKRIVWLGIVIIIIGLFVLYSQQTASQKSKHFSSRHLSGIFKLPADGRIVNKDKDGQDLFVYQSASLHHWPGPFRQEDRVKGQRRKRGNSSGADNSTFLNQKSKARQSKNCSSGFLLTILITKLLKSSYNDFDYSQSG